MREIGSDASLGTGAGNGGNSDRVERHRSKSDCFLFTDGEQHVHFPFSGIRIDAFRARDEFVRNPGTSRNDDDDLMSFVVRGLYFPGNVLDSFDVADRGSTVFLNNS
jgi:hypothetical protein